MDCGLKAQTVRLRLASNNLNDVFHAFREAEASPRHLCLGLHNRTP